MNSNADSITFEIDGTNSQYFKNAKDFFSLLTKTVKARLVYPSSSKLPAQFKEKLAALAADIFQAMEVIDYDIKSGGIFYDNNAVYEANDKNENFAHIFFRDGITKITFKKGVTREELDRLVDILAKALRSVYVDNDLATLFWEEDFPNIEYELIDDDLEIETIEYSLESFKSSEKTADDIIALLNKDSGLATVGGDAENNVESAENGVPLNGYQSAKAATRKFLNDAVEITAADRAQIAELLVDDAGFDATDYLLKVIFEILGLEKELDDFAETLDLIGKVRDNFIRLGIFEGAAYLLERMQELLTALNKLDGKRAEKIRNFFLECASQENIALVVNSLNELHDISDRYLVAYLNQLPWAAIDPLICGLGELRAQKARRAVCQVLAEIGQDQIDLLARGLDDERWYVVRNIVLVLGEIGDSRVLNYLKKTTKHPDFRVRWETLIAVAKTNMQASDDFMILALSDPETKIQTLALDYLVEARSMRGFKAIEHRIKDKKFKDRTPEQVRKYLSAYAAIGRDNALPLLEPLAVKKVFFASARDERLRLLAIEAIGHIKTAKADAVLKVLIQNKNRKIAATAMKALNKKG